MIDRTIFALMTLCVTTVMLAACNQEERPGEVETFDAISDDEVITLLGTEPFWSMEIKQGVMLYTTPENPEGEAATVSRFAGNNGLGMIGELGGEALAIAITPGQCSDAMSDRTYPYYATVTIGSEQLNGCGYTDQQPFAGAAAP
ncbi:COG3650 family protein [Altererythrobacter sp. GH1-8]|uniref:COG3650 family protein n=1 Tax=Altererythrobacter sp. GH1-8 TaxID=3349333 RepID=UPI00374DC9B5